MEIIEQNLARWQASLRSSIPIAGLISRNRIAYGWKAPFRSWVLREAAFWRITDLLTQSYTLHQLQHALGARILLRSGFETLATLIYLNQLIKKVLVEEQPDFYQFNEKTSVLLLGSRDGSTKHKALNIVTILQRCSKQYPDLDRLYSALSESAHPNREGLLAGFSKLNQVDYEVHLSNRWAALYGKEHTDWMEVCMAIFEHEYNEVWPDLMKELEIWIVEHDGDLRSRDKSATIE